MNSYLLLEVKGLNINRFLLKCNKNNINILKIKYKSYKSVIIMIKDIDYMKLIKIKGIYKIRIINKKGKNNIIDILIKYKVFIITFIFGILLLILLSNVIFGINIIGDNNSLNKKIKNELIDYGIDKYKFKKNYNRLQIIKNKIRNKYKDNIEWIEIKEDGVYYIVNYVERKKSINHSNNKIYSIISKRNGIVKDIYTYKGISLVDINDYVNKGDVLISSDLILNEEIKDKVSAEGKVYAEVWYKVNIEYPLRYKEKKYTNNKKRIVYLKIGKKYYELTRYKHFTRRPCININNEMNNIEIGIEEIKEIKISNKKYTEKEAISKAKQEAKKKILLKINDDEHIIGQKTLKFYNNGSKIIVDMFFSVYEEIGEKKVIEMGEVDDTKNIN